MTLINRQVEHPYLDILSAILAAVVIVGSVLGYSGFRLVENEKRQFTQRQETYAAAIAEFDRVMRSRDDFLAVSAKADATLSGISNKINDNTAKKAAWDKEAAGMQASYEAEVAAVKEHNDAENDKYKADPRYTTREYWTLPSNPGSPVALSLDFSADVAALSINKAEVEAFLGELKKTDTAIKNNDARTIFLNLLKSAEALNSALGRDMEILNELVAAGRQGQIVNDAKAGLIKYDAEDEWLKASRARAVEFIEEYNLDLKDYDVPGGSDVNPQDKSLL